MNRKLHNTLNAAMACSALLILAMMAGVPLEQPAPDAQAIVVATHASTPAGATGIAAAPSAPTAAMTASSEHRVPRRSYQSVRMPFFSFFLPQD